MERKPPVHQRSRPDESAASASEPPHPRKQVRHRPPSSYLPNGVLPRLQDGTIVVNYVGPFSPTAIEVFTGLGPHVRGLKFSRKSTDEMKLYAEIGPDLGYDRLQVLLGTIRTLATVGTVNGLSAQPTVQD